MNKIDGKKELTELELLAPAGSFETFRAVIQAGADAVYLGGNQFGARAYANNFSEEELCKAIDFAHLHERKVFMTVNTLFKEQELEKQLYDYLLPYYKQGLDAVIVQDLGAFSFIRKAFPDMAIHTSTQMTITDAYGAKLMKDMGATRVVTAREMSLAEIRNIYDKVDIEIESFVHGALCYCFSGQCLLSSMLGGRSGNRGRCAQPCRLPYEVFDQKKERLTKGETFILSPKDLCTIEFLPELAQSGVYSYKIEGRMKQAEYAAGVVSIYREYMDRYLTEGANGYGVSKADMQKLIDFGNRSGFTKGYYYQHNGKNMITFEKPNHSKSNDALQKQIHDLYVDGEIKENINGKLRLKKDFPAILEVSLNDITVTVEGDVVQEARKQPLSMDTVAEKLRKTGNTPFSFHQLDIEMDEDIFMPIQAINALRRDALEQLWDKRIVDCKRDNAMTLEAVTKEETRTVLQEQRENNLQMRNEIESSSITDDNSSDTNTLVVSVERRDQLELCLAKDYVTGIYLDSTCYQRKNLAADLKEDVSKIKKAGKRAFFILPAIFRKDTASFYETIVGELKQSELDGFVLKTIDEVSFAKENMLTEKEIVLDQSLYSYNNRSQLVLTEIPYQKNTIPFELNRFELKDRENELSELILYGYLPLMTSAQCVHANTCGCDKKPQVTYLKDRYGKYFPVKNQCMECYNTLYNTTPLVLFGYRKELEERGIHQFRLSFTIEEQKEMSTIFYLYENAFLQKNVDISEELKGDYTNGHYKRGVE